MYKYKYKYKYESSQCERVERQKSCGIFAIERRQDDWRCIRLCGIWQVSPSQPSSRTAINKQGIQNHRVKFRQVTLWSPQDHKHSSSESSSFALFNSEWAKPRLKLTLWPLTAIFICLSISDYCSSCLLWGGIRATGDKLLAVAEEFGSSITGAAVYWCCSSRWWNVHLYARAHDANFSILC